MRVRRWFLRGCTAYLLVGSFACKGQDANRPAQPTPAGPSAADGESTLKQALGHNPGPELVETAPVPHGGDALVETWQGPNGQSVELALRQDGEARHWELHLAGSTGKKASYRLSWPAGGGPPRSEPAGFEWGTGPGSQAWATGEESTNSAVSVRPLSPTDAPVVVLVTQRAGFEHVKRRHEIVAAIGGKWERLWEAQDGSGPQFSYTEVFSANGGPSSVLYVRGQYDSEYAIAPSELHVEALALEAGRVTARPVDPWRVVFLRTDDLTLARQATSSLAPCLGGTWLLREAGKSGDTPSLAVEVFAPTRAAAEALARAAAQCLPQSPEVVAPRG